EIATSRARFTLSGKILALAHESAFGGRRATAVHQGCPGQSRPAPAPRRGARPHRPALRRQHVRGLLPRARDPRARLEPGRRVGNTDDPLKLQSIIHGLAESGMQVVLPIHPRTRSRLGEEAPPTIKVIDPVGYLDMLALEDAADRIVTDSGGVQKEAYFIGKPCITLRDSTEWTETVEAGWNVLVGADPRRIAEAVSSFQPSGARPGLFGDGHAAEKIVNLL